MKKLLATVGVAMAVGGPGNSAMAADAGSTTIHGQMFTDFTWFDQQRNGQETDLSGYGFDVSRFYFGAEHIFDDTWSVKVTTDFNYVRNDDQNQVYIKKAYVQARFSQAAVFRAGSAAMPWIPFVENSYGYRYIEGVIVDRLGFGNSYDWGLHLGGTTAGGFSYQTALVNGAGYKNATRDSSMDFAARVSFEPVEGLVLALGGYNGDRGQDTTGAPASHTATRYNALAAYVRPTFRVGAAYFRASNWNNILTLLTDSANGYSLFASVAVATDMSVFARYDHADLSNDLDPSLTDEYYHLGAAFDVRDNIEVAAAYKHEQRGGARTILETDEIGVWAKVKF